MVDATEAEFDTRYTDEIVCPYCGEKHEGDSETGNGTSEMDCCKCERTFCYEPDYTVSFCSWTLEDELANQIKNDEANFAHYEAAGDQVMMNYFGKAATRNRERLAALAAVATEETV